MFKISLFLLICISLFAENYNIKVLANDVKGEGEKLIAKGDVVIYTDRYVLSADRAIYDKKTDMVELFGNISIIKDSRFFAKSKYAKVNIKDDSSLFEPFFFDDSDSGIWMESKDAKMCNGVYYTKNAIVSSCNVKDPDWKITYSSGDYSKNTSFVTLHNAFFYIKNIPIFYTPYLKFSTNNHRKSGLLRPQIGYGTEEGLLYVQPIYFAPFDSWDFEIDPQIRQRRGEGAYATLRFVDSKHSKGSVTFGDFEEKNSYVKKYNLKNDSHYGYEINYVRDELFSHIFQDDSQDGLLIDYKYLNDVDYLNLKKSKNYITSSLITSKVNYFMRRDKDYAGLYLRYFKDTSKTSNTDTLQTLPKLQYHRFTEPLIFKNLLFSVDYKFNNYYRKVKINATQNELLIPISLTFPVLNDYLNLSVSENVYLTRIGYSNDTVNRKPGQYISNYHKFSLTSNLTKKYDNFLHTIDVSLDYIVPSFNDKKGYFADFIALNKEKKSINFQLEEFFYSKKGDLLLTHRMSQSYFFDSFDYKYGDLLNEIIYKHSDKLTLTNDITYSHKYSEISKIQTGVNYKGDKYHLDLLYTYKNSPILNDTSLITANISTDFSSKYNYFFNIDYDIKKSYTQNWEFGVTMNKKCWDYKISYKQKVTPILTSAGSNSVTRKGVYLTINFTPIGGIRYKYERDNGQ